MAGLGNRPGWRHLLDWLDSHGRWVVLPAHSNEPRNGRWVVIGTSSGRIALAAGIYGEHGIAIDLMGRDSSEEPLTANP